MRNISFLTSVSGTECQGCQRTWRVVCIKFNGLEDWRVGEYSAKGKCWGGFPGVDHAPEDSRLPHSGTRGALADNDFTS